MKRCTWPVIDVELEYHDNEWCKESHDNRYLFEMLVLEMMQAGLSWRTILLRREAYRKAFHNFDIDKISKMDESDVKRLMQDASIIRHKLKITSIIHNAKLIKENNIDMDSFMWKYVDFKQIINDVKETDAAVASNKLSTQISNDLKKIGFKFVGPTIMYSYMQAIGMIDDHINTCDFKNNRP